MNKPTSPVILAIGAHVGDMELTAGGLLSTLSLIHISEPTRPY